MKPLIQAAVVAAWSLAGCATQPAAPTPLEEFRVLARYPVGGVGGWDLAAFDEGTQRLYLSHTDRVVVMDTAMGTVAGEINGTRGVHGIALAPEFKRGFTSNGAANTVGVFDLDTLKLTGEIKIAGKNPDAILYDPATRRIFSFNGRSNNATVIDAQALQVVATIELPGKPELAVSNGAGMIFVNIEDRSQIVAIDAATATIRNTWTLSPGEEPSGLAIDAAHRRLFAVCSNHKMIVLDSGSGRLVQEVAIGDGPDSAAFDAATGLVYSSNGEGSLTVVHEDDPDHYRVVATVATQAGARTMALDPVRHRVFLPAAELGPRPEPTAERPHPRPSIVPGTFTVLVVGT